MPNTEILAVPFPTRRDPFARKPLSVCLAEAAGEGAGRLKRRFGPVSLTLFGIGTMIGLGIFVVTGQVAARSAGPAIWNPFLVASALVALSALCYAGLSSTVGEGLWRASGWK